MPSNDPNSEYLSDGITESLINNLSQVPNLTVMSRASDQLQQSQNCRKMT